MNKPSFTNNPRRIARLEFNYANGAKREKIATKEREEMDRKLLYASPEHVNQLFANVEAIRKRKAVPVETQLSIA
ncbi:hypothetical protein ABL78_7380 [Leptomonas seymouri]|uniref:Uncharacterized protein n=1 Tax=Leptomonas seymouri TaxID=5684 RepID=A0A0N0P3E6_LEPSE|nr:hypothetical protein ABL78_7380 [Leptomonas seymouri]|eukprot:KPI83577.1 hypothetical protein ABL78_7380 [Leptomonas seymouri]